ncbi:hypothetical protein L21SP2_2244 [Salinispira pacifica]|uniref:Uncharacterized protein n=2 Tax=Salinispira pacifica TaxID=1307761 RepID=V5WJ04_9SPIO|nr:hypothetical protein L21SP2_2244 [Salinispira pacifica]
MRLMAKLSKSRMGIISTAIHQGERESQGIIVCEPGEQIFYSYLLDEELLDVFENVLLPMPTKSVLEEKNIIIPNEYVTPSDFKTIAGIYVNKQLQGTEIFSLELGNEQNDQLIFTRNAIKRLLTIHIAKMRGYFQSSNFLALMGSVMEMSLTELRSKVSARNPEFWKTLGSGILEHQADLRAQRKVKLPDDLFPVSKFLMEFLQAQIEVAKERKKQAEERKQDMKTLEEIISKSDSLMVAEELFESHLDAMREKYADQFTSFRREFEEAYLQPESHKNLPTILKIEGHYVHENNIKPLFLQRVEKLGKELYRIYLPLMSKYIRSNRSDLASIFNSTGTFEHDIQERVRQMDSLLASLLTKPSTVAEAFIQNSRLVKELKDVEEMKSVLVGFFYPERIQFKELQIIFNLGIKDIYMHAFLNFGILRQLILRITGRHESFQKKFGDQMQSIYRRMVNEAALPEHYSPQRKRAREDRAFRAGADGSRGPRSSSQRKLSTGRQGGSASGSSSRSKAKVSGKVSGKPEIIQKKRLYSRQEQDSAWSEFSKSIKK